jgi:betaine reductase
MAAALVKSGLFHTVAVIGGGSLAKLGMKYQGHLRHNMPVLEDMLASIAVLVSGNDSASPLIDLDCVGRHAIGAGASQLEIAEAIVFQPLEKCGLHITDIDRFATELHNPELTLPQGSGNVPQTNYRILAALAARHGELAADQIDSFVKLRGMPGFSPTQGHIASAVPFLGHARQQILDGTISRVFFYAKGSLFLGRMTTLADGFSFLLRRNGSGKALH